MISKEKLTEIVQKSVEDAWYNRRSLNPVKEQTEIITNAIWEQLNKPDVSNNEVAVETEKHKCINCGKEYEDIDDAIMCCYVSETDC